MGQMIEFASNGDRAGGYLAVPESGSGPGVMVIQEWWGLVPQIKSVCDRLADAGYVALAPDLYHGELAEHDEMDKASHLMTTLDIERAVVDMGGAISHLLSMDSVTSEAIGVVGYCMGGMLSLLIGSHEGDRVAAVATFYGAPLGDGEPDWSALSATVVGQFAENDDFFPPDAVMALGEKLAGMGKNVSFTVHPGSGHAFTNEENPFGTYDKALASKTWDSMLTLFATTL